MDKILLIGSFQAFFLAALLIRKKEKATHDYLIGVWLIFLGLYVSVYSLSPSGFFIQRPWLINSYISLLLLNGPFLYYYVKALIDAGFKLKPNIILHLLPFVTFILYSNISISPEIILNNPQNSDSQKVPFLYRIFLAMVAVSVPFYLFWTIRLLRKHRKIIANNYSSTDKRNLLWLRNLISSLGIAWTVLVIIFFTHHVLLLFSDDFCISGLFLTLSVFIIVVGYYGLNQPAIFISQVPMISEEKTEETTRYSGSTLKEEDLKKFKINLDNFMISEKPFLKSEITLYQLANEACIPPHYLSRIINEHNQQNFFDFINQFRVEDFKSRLKDPHYSNFTLLAIAFECGFNSKASFNRFFKKSTGQTPSEYKNSLAS